MGRRVLKAPRTKETRLEIGSPQPGEVVGGQICGWAWPLCETVVLLLASLYGDRVTACASPPPTRAFPKQSWDT